MQPSDIARWQGSVNSWLAQGSVYGAVAAPAGVVVFADTGQLPAGWYDFTVHFSCTGVGGIAIIRHRNAGNSADLHMFPTTSKLGNNSVTPINNWKVSINERIRIENLVASGLTYRGTIAWVKRG